MKNVIIAILVAVVIIFAFLLFTQKKNDISYEPWPETTPATVKPTTTNNYSVQNNPAPISPTPTQTNSNNNSGTTTINSGLKLFTTANYSFRAPSSWKQSGVNFEGCMWGGVQNDTSDGLRQAGEVGIYPKSCFNLSNADYQEMTEIDGYYILAVYNRENGTTVAEEAETKAAYQSIITTFQVQ